MNTKSLIAVAAFAALASGATFAGEADPAGQFAQQVQSTQTRAAVQAELVAFKKGANPWSTSYNPIAGFQSSKTRAEVQGEYLANRDAVAAINSEDSGSTYLSHADAPRTVSTTLAGTPVNGQ